MLFAFAKKAMCSVICSAAALEESAAITYYSLHHLRTVTSFVFKNKSLIKPRDFFNDDIKQVTISSCRRWKVRSVSPAHADWLNSFCQSQFDDTLTLLRGLLQ